MNRGQSQKQWSGGVRGRKGKADSAGDRGMISRDECSSVWQAMTSMQNEEMKIITESLVARNELRASLRLWRKRAAVTVSTTRLRVEPRPESKRMAQQMLGWFGFEAEGLLRLQRRRRQRDGATGVDLRDGDFGLEERQHVPKGKQKKRSLRIQGGQNERQGGEAEAWARKCTGHAPPSCRRELRRCETATGEN